MIRQNQQTGQKQTMNLSPQQIQLLHLIQLGTLELEQRIEFEMLENPALESDASEMETNAESSESSSESTDEVDVDLERFEIIEQYQRDDQPDDSPNYANSSAESRNKLEDSFQQTLAQTYDFREQLKAQITVLQLPPREKMLAGYIVDSLDDDGYLRISVADLADMLSFAHEIIVEESEVESELETVQSLEPAGIGARDLRECLLLQIENLPHGTENADLALRMVQEHLDDLAAQQYEKIARNLLVSLPEIHAAAAFIKKLSPRPVAGQTTELQKNQNIIPEFVVEKDEEGRLRIYLPHANSSELHVSQHLRELLHSMQDRKPKQKDKAALQYLRSKVDAATWFVEMVRQREYSMLVTMQAIVQLQQEYFLTGDPQKRRPMILKDVAQIAQLDISTISRVTSLKYARTDFGMIHLKDLFQQGIAKTDGELVTHEEICRIISMLISNENKQHALSDQDICNMLREKGYTLARRTVAKYRDAMHIPIASRR